MNLPPGIESLPNGQWIVAGDTHIGKWAKEHGNIVSDPHLMRFLDPVLKDCRTVWDIGANIGDHTRYYLDKGLQVVAVEPHPVAFRCLKHNCPDAYYYEFAASDRHGGVNFQTSSNVGASRVSETGEWSVLTERLDEFRFPEPSFVKIDVEGYELHVLRGMEETIKRRHPVLFVEVNRGALEANGETPESLKEFLLDHGYTDFEIYPKEAKWEDPQFDILVR